MDLPVTPLDRPQTLKDQACRRIRDLLSRGEFRPETVYSANQLAGTLGVSRTPVREALLELAAEGFLAFVEGRGFRIRAYSKKETEDFFEARRLIESYVAERLASKLGPGDLEDLERNLKLMKGLAARREAVPFLEADREFHMTLVRRYSNSFLESVMEKIRNHIPIFGLRAVARAGRFEEVVREHDGIVQALRRGDPRKAARAMLDHLVATERAVLVGQKE
jgi:DNA-binding GntR family transcriptional regulator